MDDVSTKDDVAAEAVEEKGGGKEVGPPQVVKVRREVLAMCMTCPLCHKLLRDATTISECLHTFCRKCIYEKLHDEEAERCPICNIDLGCSPLEKLRADHNLQDLRAKIFPIKRRKVEAPEVASSFTLPVRRKERSRSISSLVVNTPRIGRRTSITGRRTRAVAGRAASLRRRSPLIDDSAEKEDDVEGSAGMSSSPETLTQMIQGRRQIFSSAEPSVNALKKDTETRSFSDKSDLWKPLNCLVEAANRTKTLKSSPQIPVIKSEVQNSPDSEVQANKAKAREQLDNKSKLRDDFGDNIIINTASAKTKKMNGISRKRKGREKMAQALVDAASSKREKRAGPIWLSLVASFKQEGDATLPQIPSCYLRIKDGSLPASFIQRYLMRKLNLASEDEGPNGKPHDNPTKLGRPVGSNWIIGEKTASISGHFCQRFRHGALILPQDTPTLVRED